MVIIMKAINAASEKFLSVEETSDKDVEVWVTPHEKRMLYHKPEKEPLYEKPKGLSENWVYDNIKDAIYHCRKIYYIYLGILCYTLLTIFTTPALYFFIEQKIELPIMNAKMPLHAYLVAAPLLLIGFFVYKQLYLQKANKLIQYAIDECNDKNQGNCAACLEKGDKCTATSICRHHRSRIYPWIIVYCRFMEDNSNKFENSHLNNWIEKFQRIFVSFSLWWLLPFILISLSVFILREHSRFWFFYMLSMTILGITVVAIFWFQQQKIPNRSVWLFPSSLAVIGAAVSVALIALHLSALKGKVPWVEKPWPSHPEVSYQGAVSPPLYSEILRSFVLADLRFSSMAGNPTGAKNEKAIYAVDLTGRRFEGANLSNAKLVKADLRESNLNNAILIETNLREATLDGATAEKAVFIYTVLAEARLVETVLKEADFSEANLYKANFYMANLERACFFNADLSNAYLTNTNVNGAVFTMANLQNTHLETAVGLDPEQLRPARNYHLAYYNKVLIDQLGFKKDHNDRVPARRFPQYDFTEALLEGADLEGANLTNSKLRKAVLSGANLSNAILNGADVTDAQLRNADFRNARMEKISFSSYTQFENVKTLFNARLDDKVQKTLETRYPRLFVEPSKRD